MASLVNGSPGVEMGMSGDAIPVPEVEPEDPAEVNMSIYDRLTDLIHMMTSETAMLIDFG